jgi:glycosyltransferase involved in cell wall biosynthesis
LGLEDKTVLCYVGTAAPYQDIDDGFARFCALAVGLRGAGRVHALCLTPEVDHVRTILVRAGIPDNAMTVIEVPQASVSEYIAAADAGFLLRSSTEVNRVSVPVKLGEYLAAGVPVVTSAVLEWNDVLLERSPAALSLDWFGVADADRVQQVESVLARLSRDRVQLQAAALSLAQQRFTWHAYLDRVRESYRRARVTSLAGARGNGVESSS